MNDPLITYLHDHVAGSTFAIELVTTLAKQHAGEPLEEFAITLKTKITEDRELLEEIINRVGKGGSALKEAAAWTGEKVSEFKLRRDIAGDFGTFQALEALALGIRGKEALWSALRVVAQVDSRLRGPNYKELCDRAQAQHQSVEDWRLNIACAAFAVVQY